MAVRETQGGTTWRRRTEGRRIGHRNGKRGKRNMGRIIGEEKGEQGERRGRMGNEGREGEESGKEWK